MEKRRAAPANVVTKDATDIESIHQEYFPSYAHEDVLRVIDECKRELGTADRDAIIACATRKLGAPRPGTARK